MAFLKHNTGAKHVRPRSPQAGLRLGLRGFLRDPETSRIAHVCTLLFDGQSRPAARLAVVLLFLSLHLLCPLTLKAQSRVEEYQLKAVFLFRFAQFVEWPTNSANGPLTFCVVGGDPFHGDLEKAIQGKSVSGRDVRVRYPKQVREAKECHVTFIQADENTLLRELLSMIGDMPVLTIGESDDFLQQGGIIRFCMEDSKVRFEINQAAAQKAHLNISSRLLLLAKNVVGNARER